MKFQTAALCYRTRRGRTEVLLITSRGTGRWVIPKGWLMSGKSASEAAAVEAWEEAGVKHGEPAGTPIGSFIYAKILKNGLPLPVEARVFPIEVRELADDYPEAHQRARRWVEPAEAAGMVDEPDLRQLLRDFTAPRCEERRETPEGG
jgi:8-oxo-dGTP pyrophosphatase MutT (NUDIX family)